MARRSPRPPLVQAHQDGNLRAVIVSRQELTYGDSADPRQDRPAFVRAASGLGILGDELIVAQDDANFLALVRPGDAARALELPAGPGGRRQFCDALGNKLDKLDLESIVVVPWMDGSRLLAFGSGSFPAREFILSRSGCYMAGSGGRCRPSR